MRVNADCVTSKLIFSVGKGNPCFIATKQTQNANETRKSRQKIKTCSRGYKVMDLKSGTKSHKPSPNQLKPFGAFTNPWLSCFRIANGFCWKGISGQPEPRIP